MSLSIVSNTTTGSYIQTENGKIVPSGRRNYLINGNFEINQYSGVISTGSGYKCDRWLCYLTNSSNAIYIAPTGINSGYLQLASVAVGDNCVAEQRIENPAQFSGKTLTLSFELFGAYATANNIPFEIALTHAGGRTSLFTGTALAGTTKTTFTFTVLSLSGYTFNSSSYLEIRPVNIVSASTTGVFGLRKVKLEDGSVATDRWHPYDGEFGGEVQACQRYMKPLPSHLAGQCFSTTVSGYAWTTAPMRVSPTLSTTTGFFTTTTGGGTSAATPTINYSASGMYISATSSSLVAGQASLLVTPAGSFLSAEL